MRSRIAGSIAACIAFTACSNVIGGAGRLQTAGLIPTKDLDPVTGGLADESAEFRSLLRLDGVPVVAEVISDSTLVVDVGDNETAPLKAKQRVALVAENGKFFRVLAKIKKEGERAALKEGFLAKDKLSLLGPASEGHTIDLQPEVLVSAPSPDGSTPAPPSNSVEAKLESKSSGDQAGEVAATLESAKREQDKGSADGPSYPEAKNPDKTIASWPVTDRSCKGVALHVERIEDEDESCAIGTATILAVKRGESREIAGAGDWENKFCNVGGSVFRNSQGSSYFKVLGSAARIRVTPYAQDYKCSSENDCASEERTLFVPTLHSVSPTATDHTIMLRDIIRAPTSMRSGTRIFRFELMDTNNVTTGSCTMYVQASSPIVLDLADIGRFDGLELGPSQVSFDLLGSGQSVQTGWIKPTMGFLARDVDGDGRITSGRELFGEGTRGPAGQRFANGYLAMSSLDHNADGTLDARDPAFSQLLVWQDLNMNGQSETGELKPLSALGITELSTAYGPSLRHGVPQLGENDVRLEARYFGPSRCGHQGCLTFDVFFATALSTAQK